MILIEYIKVIGIAISLYLVIFYKQQGLSAWIKFKHCRINYGDLMLGYFISTFVCSIIYWPNISTYAAWLYYAIVIVTISTYQMLFYKHKFNICIIMCNLLIIAELITISLDDFYWQWQISIIIIGVIASSISPILIAISKYYIEQLLNNYNCRSNK